MFIHKEYDVAVDLNNRSLLLKGTDQDKLQSDIALAHLYRGEINTAISTLE